MENLETSRALLTRRLDVAVDTGPYFFAKMPRAREIEGGFVEGGRRGRGEGRDRSVGRIDSEFANRGNVTAIVARGGGKGRSSARATAGRCEKKVAKREIEEIYIFRVFEAIVAEYGSRQMYIDRSRDRCVEFSPMKFSIIRFTFNIPYTKYDSYVELN